MDYASIILTFFILLVLMLFPNLADRARERGQAGGAWASMGYLLVSLLYLFILGVGLAILGFGAMASQNPDLLQNSPMILPGTEINLLEEVASFNLLGYGLALPAIIGLLVLLPPVRRAIAKLIPIDAQSSVHAMALSLAMLVIVQLAYLLGVGLDTLSTVIGQQEPGGMVENVIGVLWAQQLLTALFGFVGVGYLTRRGLGETLERLGIVMPSLAQVGLGIGTAFLLLIFAVVATALLEQVGIGFDEDVGKLSEQLLGSLFTSPIGIITVGAAAAIGEETLLRGALQPRFGILLTSILFALLHANYGITLSTALVFIAGAVFGVLRQRHNTTTAMIAHALFNSTQAMLAYWGVTLLGE